MALPTPSEIVRRLYEARARDDREEVRALLHPDVVWREPSGRATYTGVHHGADAVVEAVHTGTLADTDGTFRLDLQHVLEHGPLAVAFLRWSAARGGRTMQGREVAVYRVLDGRIVEAAFHLDEPEATDAFFR